MPALERIEVYVDDGTAPAQVLAAPPFDLAIDTATLTDGEHTLRVVSRFADGRSRERRVEIVVRNHREPVPEVAIEGLDDGGQVSGVIRATVVVKPSAGSSPGRLSWVLSSLIIAAVFLGVWVVFALASFWMPVPRTQGGTAVVTPPPSGGAPAASTVSPGSIKAGAQQFQVQGCSRCHTIAGTGGTVGPDLTHVSRRLSRSDMQTTITHGKGGMPAFGTMPPADLNALLDYLQSLK